MSDQYGPKAILAGEVIQYKYYSIPFGTYCQIHEEDAPRNSMAARTRGAKSLGPSGNLQGGQNFYTLNTGTVVCRRSWTVVPMTETVIERVNKLAEDQPNLLVFYDRNGNEIGDADAGVDGEDDADAVEYEIPGVVGDDNQIQGVDMANDNDAAAEVVPPENDDQDIIPPEDPQPDDDELIVDVNYEPEPNQAQVQPAAPEPAAEQSNLRRSTRIRQPKKTYEPTLTAGQRYDYANTQLKTTEMSKKLHQGINKHEFDPRVVETVMTQLSLKAAIKMWGSKAMIAAEAEMKQLNWRNSFRPVKWTELSSKQRETILESHIFIKKKRTGEVKGRTVAGGNKQRDYIDKEESSSPTVATESVILTSMVDAIEEREVMVIDVPNAFIQTVVEDESKRVIIQIRGMLVDILVKIAPDVYKDYASVDKRGNKQLLVECLNALYGTMVASLLYYQKFTMSL